MIHYRLERVLSLPGSDKAYEGIATAFERRSMNLFSLASTYFWNFSRSDIAGWLSRCDPSGNLYLELSPTEVVRPLSWVFKTCITELYSTGIRVTNTPHFISTFHVVRSGSSVSRVSRSQHRIKTGSSQRFHSCLNLKYGWTRGTPYRSR